MSGRLFRVGMMLTLGACASTPSASPTPETSATTPVPAAPATPRGCTETWQTPRAQELAEAGDALMEGAATRAAASCTGETEAECRACIDAALAKEAETLIRDMEESAALLNEATRYGEARCPADDHPCIFREAEVYLRATQRGDAPAP